MCPCKCASFFFSWSTVKTTLLSANVSRLGYYHLISVYILLQLQFIALILSYVVKRVFAIEQILSGFVLLSILLLISTTILCWLTSIRFSLFLVLLEANLWSKLEWFFWSAPYFSFRFPIDRRNFYNCKDNLPSSPNRARYN